MPCLVANCAVVNSPRSASNATFALKSAEYRFRLLVIQVRLSQKRTELNHLSKFWGPAQLDAASVLVDRRARRAKTDRLDAAGLLRTLMALERGETQVCRVVRVPSLEQEDARRRSRERARLIVERSK